MCEKVTVGPAKRKPRCLSAFDKISDAQPFKHALQERIESPIAKAILEGRFAAKDRDLFAVHDAKISRAKA
jgi:ATP-dependent Clp protease ATP-binding subunit ClpB